MEFEARRAARLALASAAGSLVAAITLVAISKGVFGVAQAASVSASPSVEAEAEPIAAMMENHRVLSYPFEQVWPTAIRFLRVDRGYVVTDRDVEAGYVLFDFPIDGERRGNGSLELFRTEDAAGRPSVSVSISTGAGPIHMPNTLLDGLAAKVREERGQPAPPPPKDQPKPPAPPPSPPAEGEDPDDGSVPLLPPATDPG